MNRNPNWRAELKPGSIVISPDDQCCVVVEIDGDTITLRPQSDSDANTFTADLNDLKCITTAAESRDITTAE